MLPSQRALFDMPRDVCFMNAAAWSPLPLASQEAGRAAMTRKGQPWKLPADFQPRNTDGEIEEFMLWPAERVLREIDGTDNFKFNVNLVVIDFLIRRGIIGPERPDYLELLAGLRLGRVDSEPL